MTLLKYIFIFGVFILSSAYPNCSYSWPLTIIKNGKARCTIVRPANPTTQEKAACLDLQTYLKKITGTQPKIKSESKWTEKNPIYIGRCNAAKKQKLFSRTAELKDDGYIIKITSEAAYLIGKDSLATRFAVFGFLEDHLGVRWYMPGDIGEVVPKTDDIILFEGEDIQEPSFKMRWVGTGEWALRNRMNVKVDKKLGLHVYSSCHTFRKLCPVETYYDEHPEYFALIDEERKKYEGKHKNQLCTSNPEVIKVVAENASKILTDRPELDVMTLFPNDGLGFCECDHCKALDDPNSTINVEDINKSWRSLGPEKYGVLSNRMAIFYNKVAGQILSKHPDKYIQCGAYSAYRQPPKNIDIKMSKHTFIQITRNFCHDLPIESGNCNTVYNEAIDGWLKTYPSFSIYEYYWKLAANELPYPIVHSIRKDIPYFYNKGGFGLYAQYSSKNVGTLGLNYYIAAKLLWNVKADVDAILDDFYHKFYGPAWEPMKAYHEALENTATNSNVHLPAKYDELLPLFNTKLLVDCDKYLSEAKLLADENNIVSKRIDMAVISIGYVKLAVSYLHSLDEIIQKYGWDLNLKKTAVTQELHNAKNLSDAIKTYLEKYKSSNCFHTPSTNYITRFLNLEYAFKKMAGRYSPKISLDKMKWIKTHKEIAKINPITAETYFDIWIYGYDFDRDKKKAEHEIYILDNNDQKLRIGELPTAGDNGNGRNRCFLLKNFSTKYLSHDKSTFNLSIVNPEGNWIASSIYAVYIMPHDASITSDKATKIIQNDRKKLHWGSFGFIEYSYYGIPNNDGKTLNISIAVTKPLSPPFLKIIQK